MPDIPEEDARKLMIEYASIFIDTEYRWGGDDFSGRDCSGFVIEVDKSVGLFPHDFDDTADGLWNRMRHAIRSVAEEPQPGDHLFWFSNDRARHVELAVNKYQRIGASGGGSPQYDLLDEFNYDPFLKSYYEHEHLVNFPVVLRFLHDFLKREEAIKRNGFVKVRPIPNRGTVVICDPFRMGE